MSNKFIVNVPLTPTIVSEISDLIDEISILTNPMQDIVNASEVKRIIPVSINREGEISAVYQQLMIPYPELMVQFTLDEFLSTSEEVNNATFLRSKLKVIVGILNTRIKLLQNNRMLMAIETLDNARVKGKTNQNINKTLKAITAEFLDNAPDKQHPTGFTIGASTTMILSNVATGKMFTNTGMVMLSILLEGSSESKIIRVNPGSGVIIPKRWTTLSITNLSETTEGSFDIFLSVN